MKKYLFFVLILFFFRSGAIAENKLKLTIAVNNLLGKGIEESTTDIISDRLRSELINTGAFRVMERNEMENVLKEQGFQKTGACEESSCIVEIGKLLGVERMVAGSIGKVGNFLTLSLRIISVATGEIIFTVIEDYKGEIEHVISDVIANAAKELALGIGGEIESGAALKVHTKPEKSTVFINGNKVGTTPYHNDRMPPGDYSLKVKKDTYEPVEITITLHRDSTVIQSFKLKHTKAFLDSVAAVKKIKKRKMQWVRRIVFGTLAAGCGAGGIYMNLKSNDAYDTYMADNEQSSKNYESLYDDVESYETIRNVLYGIAGGFTLGFVISIPF